MTEVPAECILSILDPEAVAMENLTTLMVGKVEKYTVADGFWIDYITSICN